RTITNLAPRVENHGSGLSNIITAQRFGLLAEEFGAREGEQALQRWLEIFDSADDEIIALPMQRHEVEAVLPGDRRNGQTGICLAVPDRIGDVGMAAHRPANDVPLLDCETGIS